MAPMEPLVGRKPTAHLTPQAANLTPLTETQTATKRSEATLTPPGSETGTMNQSKRRRMRRQEERRWI